MSSFSRSGAASNSLLESLVFAKRAAILIAQDNTEKPVDLPGLDLKSYPVKAVREKEFKKLIMDEIRGKDREFYDKWCNHEN